jgi:hypothetical protein
MIHTGLVVTVDGERSVVERRKQITLDVPHVRRVVVQAFQNVLYVQGVQFEKSAFYDLGGLVVTLDSDGLFRRADGIKHNLEHFVQFVGVVRVILSENLKFKIIHENIPVTLHRIHRIHLL